MSDVDTDVYPSPTKRRRFVKGVVGASALTGLAVIGEATVDLTTNPTGEGGGITEYYGIDVVGGPAPRGMPQIPVEIDDEGYLRGVWPSVETVGGGADAAPVARTQLGGIVYSNEWFQYCGVETAPGVDPTTEEDNYFRYAESSQYEWQNQEVSPNDRVNVADFEDYETWGNGIGQEGVGKPALVTWRSTNVEDSAAVIPVQLIRSVRIERAAQDNQWMRASTQQGFIAILDKCTHFCCVPGYKIDPASARFGAANGIYCPCHQSVYDPFVVSRQSFVAFPRPEGDE
ncbi:ubiquinol-cytochrome c reductase iron-sulfur subunit [Haloprofundus salilacus]|uniref:ubiquinol-cytochrome c reductase iron-sulfur subunit n=1 Tax=Haloprofundus salilacus TaxID=2876190 RepID=UPI001CCEADC3|nr:ubiquinol-cytochrome c reductase iron-sulfur subunit [Haloprofundus salilacus]